jgi:hypothetical protein
MSGGDDDAFVILMKVHEWCDINYWLSNLAFHGRLKTIHRQHINMETIRTPHGLKISKAELIVCNRLTPYF